MLRRHCVFEGLRVVVQPYKSFLSEDVRVLLSTRPGDVPFRTRRRSCGDEPCNLSAGTHGITADDVPLAAVLDSRPQTLLTKHLALHLTSHA
jgi:hypothetical protein